MSGCWAEVFPGRLKGVSPLAASLIQTIVSSDRKKHVGRP